MRMEKVLSLVLAFAMIAGMFVVPARADNTVTITQDTDGQKGQMTITLTIAAASVTTAPQANTLTYTGAAQALVTAGAASTDASMEYALGENSTTAPTSGFSTTVPTGSDAKTYYVWYRATDSHGSSTAACVSVEIQKVSVTATVTATDRAYVEGNTKVSLVAGSVSGTVNNDNVTVDVSSATGTMANDAAGKNKAVTVTGVTLSGAKAGNYTLSAQPTGVTVTINKSTPSAPAAPTAASTTKNCITLTAHDGYEYKCGDGAWTTNNVFSGLAPSTAYSFYQRVKETDNTNASASSTAASFSTTADTYGMTITLVIVDKDTQTITASDVTAAYGETGKKVTASTSGNGTLSYAVKSGSDVISIDASSGALTIKKVGTAVVTVTASETNTGGTGNKGYAAATKDVSVTISKGTPSYTVPTGLSAAYGQTLADVALPSGWAWANNAQSVGNVGTHTFKATFTPTDTENYITVSNIDVSVTIGKVAATVTTAPTARALTYTGVEQALVSAGTASGGVMQYVIGTDRETAPVSGYSEAIPTAKNAGTYYVWYKVAGDSDHSDTDAVCVTVTISPKSVTVSGLTAADKEYDGTTSATFVSTGATFTGKTENDTLTVTGTAAFADANAGDSKTVNFTGLTLGGDSAGNYVLSATTATGTGKITQKPVTVTAAAQSVALNGSIDAGVTKATLTGALSGHTLTAITLTASSTAAVTGSGTITPSAATIKDGETDVTANYAITYANGVLTVTKIDPTVTAPTPNTLTYSGEAQALVAAGSADTGATMKYALAEDGEYSTTIPTGINAGDYTVWYKVEGGDNYSDTDPESVSVTIGKATMPTPTLRLVTVQGTTYTDKTSWGYGETNVVPYVEGNISGGVVTAVYSANGLELSEAPTDAGSYTVKAKIAATANYHGVDATNTVSFTITKAPHSDVTAAQTVTVSRNGVTGGTLDLSAYLTDATGWAVKSTDGTLITAASNGGGNILNYTAAQTTAASSAGNVQITVTSRNYADYTLTVNFRTASAFTLRFESNGGTEIPSRILNENAAYGELPTASQVKRIGYTFGGWYIDAALTTQATAQTSIGSADATVYAKWTVDAHTITLNLGVHGTLSQTTITYSAADADFVLPVPADVTEDSGTVYTFGGWRKSADSPAQINVTIQTANLEDATYTALWVEGKKEGEVTFTKDADADTGLMGLESMDEGTVSTEDAGGSAPAQNLAEVMKEVACAESKAEEADKTVTVAMDVQPVNKESGALPTETKTAIEAIKQQSGSGSDSKVKDDVLTIEVEKTTAPTSGDGETTTEKLHDIGRVVEIPLQYNMTGRYQPRIFRFHDNAASAFRRLASRPVSGFVDGTYYVSGFGASAVIYIYTEKFSTYSITTTETPTHTVMFETNGGTEIESVTVEDQQKLTKPADPTKESADPMLSYVFDGWYSTADFSAAYDFDSAVTKDMTVYAKWREVVVYTITFNPNEGTVTPESTVTGVDGKLSSLPTPTRSGSYRFDGWYTAKTGGEKVTTETVFIDNTEIFARWTTTSSGGGNTSGGGGGGYSGGGGNSSDNAVTIPVSGDANTVSVSATVSGTTATVAKPTASQLEKVIGAGVKTGTVVIDLSGLKTDIVSAGIPTETLKEIARAVNDSSNDASALTVKLTDGSITFDGKALAAVVDQSKGSEIRISLDSIRETRLNDAQHAALKEMDVQAVYDAYIVSNGVRISDLKGGRATVTAPYTLTNSQQAKGLVVWYVAESGDKEEVPASYGDKEIRFTVTHFSNYILTYDAERVKEETTAGTDYKTCLQDAACPISAFSDASPTAWYHDGVHYVLDNGIMSGMGNGLFAPNRETSRAMIAQILWNMEGRPVVNFLMTYKDVDPEAWYAEAIRWANSEGLMDGYGNDRFGPNDTMTREQLVTVMYRYAQRKGIDVSVGEDTNILSYDDAYDVSEWAASAMQWAVGSGLISGRTSSTLNPKDTATRAEIATIMMRYCTEIAE